MPRLRIGSRGSQLALWQANHVASLLRERGHEVEIQVIRTTGDKMATVLPALVGTKGMFTKEIEEALAAGEVDLAVHSFKDLPTELAPGFHVAAVMEREDSRDVLLSVQHESLAALPQGSRVGTSSLRREAQLKALRRDLEVVPLRGNVDTRLRKLESGEFDAIVLAAAGVRRLGLLEHVREFLPVEQMCPAAGQGALALECRAGDTATGSLLQFLDHPDSRRATLCERAVLHALGGGCQVPIGVHAEAHSPGELRVSAVVARPDGSELLRESAAGDEPLALGRELAQRLLSRGAAAILRDIYGREAAVPQIP